MQNRIYYHPLDTENCFLHRVFLHILFLCTNKERNLLNHPMLMAFEAAASAVAIPVFLNSPVGLLKAVLKDLKCIMVYLLWEV